MNHRGEEVAANHPGAEAASANHRGAGAASETRAPEEASATRTAEMWVCNCALESFPADATNLRVEKLNHLTKSFPCIFTSIPASRRQTI